MFQVEAIGNVYANGGTLKENVTPFRLDQNQGILWDIDRFRHEFANIAAINGLKVIASGPTVSSAVPIVIPKTFDDGAGGETALTTNLWASHTILKSPKGADDDGAEGTFVLVVSGSSYGSQGEAQNGSIEFGPFSVDQFVPVGRVLVRGGSVAIEEIVDERPIIGTSTGAFLVNGGANIQYVGFNPYACYNIDTPAATTIGVAGTFVKMAGTTAEVTSNDFTISTSNRATYTGALTRRFKVDVSASLTSSVSNQIISLQFAKNGVVISSSEQQRFIAAGADVGNISLTCLPELVTNDYIEVFCTIIGTTGTVTSEFINVNLSTAD